MNKQIDPGEGWRLLGEDEVIQRGDEFKLGSTLGGGDWSETCADGSTPYKQNPFIYRRRIADDGWVKTSERLPKDEDGDASGCVMVYERDSVPLHQITGTYCVSRSEHTHWRKLPPPPIPEQSEEDKAFEAFNKWYENSKHIGCKEAWYARGEWEKTRGKK